MVIRSEVRSKFARSRRPRGPQLQSISDQIEFGQSEPHGGALSNVLSIDLKSSSLTSLPRNQTLSPKRINVGSEWVSCFDNIADSIFNPFSAKSKTSSNPVTVKLSEENLSSDFLLGKIILTR